MPGVVQIPENRALVYIPVTVITGTTFADRQQITELCTAN